MISEYGTYNRANSLNRKAFEVIWTSFGLGQAEAFDPSLGGALRDNTSYLSFTKGKASFGVVVDENRNDLKLLAHLMRNGVKEFYVENYTNQALRVYPRMKFTVIGLDNYHIGQHRDDDSDVTYTTFDVSGVLEVITD